MDIVLLEWAEGNKKKQKANLLLHDLILSFSMRFVKKNT